MTAFLPPWAPATGILGFAGQRPGVPRLSKDPLLPFSGSTHKLLSTDWRSLRDALPESFRRDPAERFDNAEQMLNAWRDCFLGIEQLGKLSDHVDDNELRTLPDLATFDTQVSDLALGTRAANALDHTMS